MESNNPSIDQLAELMAEGNPQVKKQLLRLLEIPAFDRSLGTVLGAFIGDALGSYCEFEASPRMGQVMLMKGGGTFNLYRGQVTDDSQMALHLAYGLDTYDPSKKLAEQEDTIIKRIAEGYVRWQQSNPFDIGMTCSSGIRCIAELLKTRPTAPDQEFVERLMNFVKAKNEGSQSNGSLMRITPMAVFAAVHHDEPEDVLERFIKKQIGLVHSNHTIQSSSYEWVRLLSLLIRRESDASIPKILAQQALLYEKNQNIAEWYAQSRIGFMNCNQSMGWAKIAWTAGIRNLQIISDKIKTLPGTESSILNADLYTHAVSSVIAGGGDTDTNGCIVGGLMGSLVGFKNLPRDYLYKLVTVDLEKSPRPRNQIYKPVKVVRVLMKMFKKY